MSDRSEAADDGVRLQKVLASAGVASRRKAEELIRDGRVKVDGIVVREMGTGSTGERRRARRREPDHHPHRPGVPGVEQGTRRAVDHVRRLGRPHIGQMLEDRSERLFHVGRLDMESEGLLLLTNDGDLAHRLTHPSYGVAKTYVARCPDPSRRTWVAGSRPGSSWRTVRPRSTRSM